MILIKTPVESFDRTRTKHPCFVWVPSRQLSCRQPVLSVFINLSSVSIPYIEPWIERDVKPASAEKDLRRRVLISEGPSGVHPVLAVHLDGPSVGEQFDFSTGFTTLYTTPWLFQKRKKITTASKSLARISTCTPIYFTKFVSSCYKLQADTFYACLRTSVSKQYPRNQSCSAGLRSGQLLRLPRTPLCIICRIRRWCSVFSKKMYALLRSKGPKHLLVDAEGGHSAFFLDLKSK